MALPKSIQNFQDWCTQLWVIVTGRKVNLENDSWLAGPFGKKAEIGESFIIELAREKGLNINRNVTSKGILASINELGISKIELKNLSPEVIDFYENTGNYNLEFSAKWNPFFKPFGQLVNWLFSHRIQQLNIPTSNSLGQDTLKSEIITLTNPKTDKVEFTFWFRTIKSSKQVLYSGIYTTCKLPSGKTCVKAIFPLPNGNATVILEPVINQDGSLSLNSSGRKFGNAGFYFLLEDSKNIKRSRYIRSFKDYLVVQNQNNQLIATQKLKLWGMQVVEFQYSIIKLNKSDINLYI